MHQACGKVVDNFRLQMFKRGLEALCGKPVQFGHACLSHSTSACIRLSMYSRRVVVGHIGRGVFREEAGEVDNFFT